MLFKKHEDFSTSLIDMSAPSPRRGLKGLADATIKILKNGYYHFGSSVINISSDLEQSVSQTQLIPPISEIALPPNPHKTPVVEITSDTTLHAGYRSVVELGIPETMCLVFSSAKNVCGGFVNGAMAQEESLAYASGLYAALKPQTKFYASHRSMKDTFFYSDSMIYAPGVPCFRDDEHNLISSPYKVDFLVSCAVNVGYVMTHTPELADQIRPLMEQRMRKIVHLAAARGVKSIILGAYGCGVFKNNSRDIAEIFRKIMVDEGMNGYFERVNYAIKPAKRQTVLEDFSEVFNIPVTYF